MTVPKHSYRRKLERKLQATDIREVWKGMRTMTDDSQSALLSSGAG